MKRVSRALWAFSLGLLLILSSIVMSVNSSTVPDTEIQASQPQPSILVNYNPWPTYNGTTVYHSFTEMETELFWIADNYPQITKLVSIGKSWQGRDIWAMKVSDNPHIEETDEPEVYFNANHHAREWMTIEITLYLLRYLTSFYGSDADITEIVNTRQIWVLPSVNPDGRVYDSAGDDPASHVLQAYGWRKNCRDNDNSGTFVDAYDGVDLNRNYGYLWGAAGATSDPTYLTYGGPYPFSEPETAAVRDFCRQHDFTFAISYHTSSQLILYPWGWAYEAAPDKDVFLSVGAQMRSAITNTAGSDQVQYTLQQSSGLYPTAGSDDDWLYGELGIFAYCIEAYPAPADTSSGDEAVVTPYDSFHPRSDKVLPVCQDNLPAALLLCMISDNPYQFMDHVSMEPATAEISIEDTATGHVAMTITDDGQRADSFNLAATGVPGWTVNLDRTTMSLARNETGELDLSITVPFGATPGTYSIWVNATSATNASCKDSSLILVTVPFPEDATAMGILPFTEMGSFPKGAYRIDGTVKNVGEVALPKFNATLTIKEIGVGGTETLFQENFETGLGQWAIIDHDMATSTSSWKTSTTQEHGGVNSAWCGVTNTYTLNTVQSLQMAQPISLKRYTSATLDFWSWYYTELYYDFLMVEGSSDNGQSWDYIARYDGQEQAWAQQTLSLAPFLGAEQFKLRFRFTSDSGDPVTYSGFYLDDILITAVNPTEALRHTSRISTSEPLDVGEEKMLSWYYNFTYPSTFLAAVTTECPNDSNPANNVSDVMFLIDNRNLPIFAGVKSVEDTGGGTILTLKWDPALQVNDPIQYSVHRFDHIPSQAEVNASVPAWTGTSTLHIDSGLTPGQTYYYVVRAEDALDQKEYNMVVKSATTTITNPLFDGIESVANSGTGDSLDLSWEQAFDTDWPITYRIYRFNHDPTNVEIDSAVAVGSTTQLTYRDSGLTEGLTYWYAVRAYDAGGNHDSNYAKESGMPSFIWHLQDDGALNNDPLDSSAIASTPGFSTVGEYRIGTDWTSDPFIAGMDIAGPWTFRVHGHATNANANGLLYAKVLRASNSQLIWTTGYDDEDIGSFTATHLFTWAGNAPSFVIPAGDSVTVEFWAHVTSTSGSIGPISNVANPTFDSDSAGWTNADWAAIGGTTYVSENWVASGGNPNGLINTAYSGVTGGTLYSSGGYWEYPFTVGFTPTSATLGLDWRCSSFTGIGGPMVFYAFIDTASGEPSQGAQLWSASTSAATSWVRVASIDVSSIVDGPGTYYLKVATSVTNLGRNDAGTGAFDNIRLNTSMSAPAFLLEHDSPITPSGIIPSLTEGTPAEPYELDLSGKSTWTFVSFPVQVSGHIETVLNDTINGDGQTKWDVAKYWDNLNKRWLTYRKGSTANTFTTINNQMGVWLHLIQNTGDEMLTLGIAGSYPSGTTNIQLYAGWNMVGYPSQNMTRNAEEALFGTNPQMISIYSATTPYVEDRTDLAAVPMMHGNAYWVLVTANVVWEVQP